MNTKSSNLALNGAYAAQVEELFNLSRKLSGTHKKHCYCGVCQAAAKIAEYVKNGHHREVDTQPA
jgi:hypothetical protein